MSTGASNDFERATKMARDMVTRYGMSDSLGTMVYVDTESESIFGRNSTKTVSELTQQKVDFEIRTLIDSQYALARSILENNRDKVEAMVTALLEWETLDADQITDIMEGRPPRAPLPPPATTFGNSAGTPGPAAGAAPATAQSNLAQMSTGILEMPTTWRCGRFLFDFTKRKRPIVMGILNTTPDSFSDGGKFRTPQDAIAQAELMIANGVDLIDIGGESTRPGAKPVTLQEELDRVLPVIEALKDCSVPLSIDTYKAETMRQALSAGVDCVNDIWALRQNGAVDAVLESKSCGIVLMHMQCDPLTMQFNPQYQDVISEVMQFLKERAELLKEKGVEANRIAIDPGFGFGKSLEHNLNLLSKFGQFSQLGHPVLAGISRKSMLGKITGKDTHERLAPSLAAAIMSADRGAKIVRVHDVPETVDALKLWEAMNTQPSFNTQDAKFYNESL